jgi:transcriptional regulator with XRE-family HTH domain
MSGSDIRLRRVSVGLSQEQLGLFIGVSMPTISRWETGSLKIQPKYLPKIERVLGICEKHFENMRRELTQVA